MYNIEQFRRLNRPEALIITQHSRKRFAERGICIEDIIYTLISGEIIEEYPDDKPFPSCLIMGHSGERVLHIAASINEDRIYITTAYSPSPEKWEEDSKTRKEARK